jgi:MFS family permease
MLLAGRLITGFGGPRVISRRYIADHVPSERRLVASSQFVTAGALGLAAGPLISSLVERSGLEYRWQVTGLLGTDREVTVWWYQAETAPGWIMAALWLIAGILVIVLFTEPSQQVSAFN